jgi:hypothetical protein
MAAAGWLDRDICHPKTRNESAAANTTSSWTLPQFAVCEGGSGRIKGDGKVIDPLMSVAIGLALLWAARASAWVPGTEPDTAVTSVFVWLGYINVTLAVFNMIPGYPLVGGRVPACHHLVDYWQCRPVHKSCRIGWPSDSFCLHSVRSVSILRGRQLWWPVVGLYRVVPP